MCAKFENQHIPKIFPPRFAPFFAFKIQNKVSFMFYVAPKDSYNSTLDAAKYHKNQIVGNFNNREWRTKQQKATTD